MTRETYAAMVLLACVGCGGAQGTQTTGKPPVAVETARVVSRELAVTVDVVGTLTPKFRASVEAEYPGRVTSVEVTEWVRVSRGTVLARLDTRELEAAMQAARANLLQAEVSASRARREHERALNLRQVGLMTEQGVEDAKTADDAAAAALEAAKAQLMAAETRLEKAVVRAPMDGVVAERSVNVGDMAGGDPLFRIIDTSVFDLEVSVPASAIHAVAVGQTLTFTTGAVPDRTFQGKVAYINPSADPASRTVKVVAEVPNPDQVLKDGYFVSGRILTSTRPGVLLVPRSALLNWDVRAAAAQVFVLEGERARRLSIRTGATEGELVEVASGLGPGDVVVARGAFALLDGDRVDVIGTRAAEEGA